MRGNAGNDVPLLFYKGRNASFQLFAISLQTERRTLLDLPRTPLTDLSALLQIPQLATQTGAIRKGMGGSGKEKW